MAQLLRLRSNGKVSFQGTSPVKLENSLGEEHGTYTKRFMSSSPFAINQQLSFGNEHPISPSQYNPLLEPSPLGLRLKKSPSLLDLIQKRLTQDASVAAAPSETKKETKPSASSEKLKASNFIASVLKIGNWEYISKYEGDLVAKCYFAKHKLVWEILQNGLKSKVEVQWADIAEIKANCPDVGPGMLTLVLSRPPIFFRETNPQPRKHTLWQSSSDFTNGQASSYRQHILQCPQGVLNKHYEKLLQCDYRLKVLSQKAQVPLDSPYFEVPLPHVNNPEPIKTRHTLNLSHHGTYKTSAFQELPSTTSASSSSSMTSEHQNYFVKEAPPSSVMLGKRNFEAFCYQEKLNMAAGVVQSSSVHMHMHMNQPEEEKASEEEKGQSVYNNIAEDLLSDTQCDPDEILLMKKVRSLICLIDAADSQTQAQVHVQVQAEENSLQCPIILQDEEEQDDTTTTTNGGGTEENLMGGMGTRKDSFAEMLLHLPRISSFDNILWNDG